jgi:hypothetical protein
MLVLAEVAQEEAEARVLAAARKNAVDEINSAKKYYICRPLGEMRL